MRRLLFCCGYISQAPRFLSAARSTLKLRKPPRKPIAPTSGDLSKDAAAASALDVFIAWMGEKSYAPAVQLARQLRDAGYAVELPPEEMKFKKSLGLADKLGATYALIIGEDEVASKQYSLKRLADGQQNKYSMADLLQHLHASRRTT